LLTKLAEIVKTIKRKMQLQKKNNRERERKPFEGMKRENNIGDTLKNEKTGIRYCETTKLCYWLTDLIYEN
jgi:hypothetical protein